MSKRLVRIFSPQLKELLPSLMNRELNIVLYNGRTFFGRLEANNLQLLTLKDLRGHQHNFAFTDIQEVIYDQVSV